MIMDSKTLAETIAEKVATTPEGRALKEILRVELEARGVPIYPSGQGLRGEMRTFLRNWVGDVLTNFDHESDDEECD